MYRKIVIGFDGAESARDALAMGEHLARTTDADLLVVNVYPREAILPSVPPGVFHEQLQRDSDHALAGARAALADGPDAEFMAVSGSSPAWALHALAEREMADLILVGSCHRGPLGRALAGSTAQKLLHGSPCAVGVAPRGYRHHAGGEAPDSGLLIGVAYDGSAEAKEALLAARDLASDVGGTVRVIDVIDLAGLRLGFGYGYAEYLSGIRDAVKDEIAEVKERFATEGMETDLREGDPAAEMSAASETLDVLYVGSRSYGPVRRVLLGSVSARLLENAACPVIVVPRGVHEVDASAETTMRHEVAAS